MGPAGHLQTSQDGLHGRIQLIGTRHPGKAVHVLSGIIDRKGIIARNSKNAVDPQLGQPLQGILSDNELWHELIHYLPDFCCSLIA
jgi:hypothetical protein